MTEFSPVTTPRLVVGKLICVYNLTFWVGGYTEVYAYAIREICEICKPFTIAVLWVMGYYPFSILLKKARLAYWNYCIAQLSNLLSDEGYIWNMPPPPGTPTTPLTPGHTFPPPPHRYPPPPSYPGTGPPGFHPIHHIHHPSHPHPHSHPHPPTQHLVIHPDGLVRVCFVSISLWFDTCGIFQFKLVPF